jgi:dihydroneopterin aldolase
MMNPPDSQPDGDGIRLVFLRDLLLMASIGIYAHEHRAPQRVRINVCLAVEDETARAGQLVGPDELRRVVDYERLAVRVREIVGAGHTRLVETLAERIAAMCLQDPRVVRAQVRIEKLDVFPDTVSAGVQVQRSRNPS